MLRQSFAKAKAGFKLQKSSKIQFSKEKFSPDGNANFGIPTRKTSKERRREEDATGELFFQLLTSKIHQTHHLWPERKFFFEEHLKKPETNTH